MGPRFSLRCAFPRPFFYSKNGANCSCDTRPGVCILLASSGRTVPTYFSEPGLQLTLFIPLRPGSRCQSPVTGFSDASDKGRNRTPFGFGGQTVEYPASLRFSWPLCFAD